MKVIVRSPKEREIVNHLTARGPASRRSRRRRGVASLAAAAAAVLTASAFAATPSGAETTLPYENADLPVQQRVDDLLSRMTLAEKVGQMTQAERAPIDGDPTQITKLGLGSVLSGGGSVP